MDVDEVTVKAGQGRTENVRLEQCDGGVIVAFKMEDDAFGNNTRLEGKSDS